MTSKKQTGEVPYTQGGTSGFKLNNVSITLVFLLLFVDLLN